MAPIAAQTATQITRPEAEDDNKPYVGPRTFRPDERQRFFGRDREARDLIARIVSERFVLFYAQSGAGKSSLINTRVVPGLEAEGFEVLPVARVSGHGGAEVAADNIFAYNLLSSLHQQENVPAGLATMSIAHFLDNLVCHDGVYYYDNTYAWPADAELKPRVLFIDQFEEIITTNTANWAEREAFFRQLGEALEADDLLWIVLALREDFIANLDPYLHLVNNGLRQRFYMQHLDREAALLAIRLPVEDLRPFEKGADEALVDNLLASRREGQGDKVEFAEFVEPVQLQAVCYQMWEKLQTRPGPTITRQDVEDFADVDTALVSFYEETIAQTVAETSVSEFELRHWFDTQLVTEAGTRNMVFRGVEDTGGLPTVVADFVKSRFIVREVVRPGGVWYELVHDRFVQPIQQANRNWLQDQPLLQLAKQWDDASRSETRLLTAGQLNEFSRTRWQDLGHLVADFIQASRIKRRFRKIQIASIAAGAIFLLGIVMFLYYTSVQLSEAINEQATQAAVAATANQQVVNQNIILTTREAELAASIAERALANRNLEAANEIFYARRLSDAASDYLNDNQLDAAILLSYRASQSDPSARARSVLFAALDGKIEQFELESSTRGAYTPPVDGDGNPLDLPELFAGPSADSLATIIDGEIYWWPIGDGGDPPKAERFPLPIENGTSVDKALFLAEQNLLVTASGLDLTLWRIDDGAAAQSWNTRLDGNVFALALSADGRRLAAAQGCPPEKPDTCRDYRINFWETASDSGDAEVRLLDKSISADKRVVDMVFRDRAGTMLVWTDSEEIVMEDLAGTEREELPRPDEKVAVTGIAMSPTQDLLVVSGCRFPSRVPTVAETAADINIESDEPDEGAPQDIAVAAECADVDPDILEWWFLYGERPIGNHWDSRPLRDLTYLPGTEQVLLFSDAGDDAPGDERLTYRVIGLNTWQEDACRIAGRNLTAGEWIDINPERNLGDYEEFCPELPVHLTVVDELLRQCEANPANDECWQSLERIGIAGLDPDVLVAARERIAEAQSRLARQEFTEVSRQLAESDDPERGLPERVAALIENETVALFLALCSERLTTDSPAVVEACGHIPQLELGRETVLRDVDSRLWRFDGEPGDHITLAAESPAGANLTLTLFHPRLEEPVYSDDFDGIDPQIDHFLVDEGPYILEVGWYGSPGPYNLRTERTSAMPLTLGEPVQEAGAEARLWTFEGRAGDHVTIAVEALDGDDPTVTLYNARFEQLKYDDDYDGLDPRVRYELPEDGSYIIEVGWRGETGRYNLTTSVLVPEALALGEARDAGPDQRLWRFEGRAGDTVTIAVEALDDGNATLSLYNARYDELAFDDNSTGDDPQIEYQLLEDGPYFVEVLWLGSPDAYTLTSTKAEPEPLALGEMTREAEDDQRLWRFENETVDFITFAVEAQAGGDPYLRLRDAQFTELAVDDSSDGLNPQIGPMLLTGGPHTLEVGWYGNPGPYTLTTTRTEPPTLSIGERIPEVEADQRLWRFEGAAGDLVTIDLESLTSGDAALSLYDPRGAQLDYNDNFIGLNPQITTGLPTDGLYTIVVDWFGTPNRYALTTTTSEAIALNIGDLVPEAGAEQQLWTFEGQAGDYIEIAAESLADGDPTLTLSDAAGGQVAYNDDFDGLNPRIEIGLPADGLYTLNVGWFGTPGAYSLTTARVEPEPLSLGDTLPEVDGERRRWSFEGRAGDWVTLALEALDGDDPTLTLYNALNEQLAFSDDFENLDPLITVQLPDNGLYVVEVGWREEPGRYSLTATTLESEPLSIGDTIPDAGDGRRLWRFQGQAGDTVTITAEALAGGDNPWLRLFGIDNETLTFSDNFDGLNPQLTVELPRSGTYTLEVGWFGEPGTYRLMLDGQQ